MLLVVHRGTSHAGTIITIECTKVARASAILVVIVRSCPGASSSAGLMSRGIRVRKVVCVSHARARTSAGVRASHNTRVGSATGCIVHSHGQRAERAGTIGIPGTSTDSIRLGWRETR